MHVVYLVSAPSIQEKFGYSIYIAEDDSGAKHQLAGLMLNDTPTPYLDGYSDYADPNDYNIIWSGHYTKINWVCYKPGSRTINGNNQKPDFKVV